ncbi:fibroblast growth factor receptor homolog 2 isoform X1 [Folsomia candida]|uniref:fibroblast growth factor receptor homolog 2 isoform X1 n=2 Tax=Folsomia candida TaxID=158441 RepID=UPI000B8F828A|nr:fibroblast growth factor receptor homolog 2 isoform X1 [Folsomia candida]
MELGKVCIFICTLSIKLLHVFGSTFGSRADFDCTSYDNKSPEIEVETSSAGFNARVPSLSAIENVEDASVSRSYFDCRDSIPVDWIMDIHPSRDTFQFTRSFYQQQQSTTSGSSPVFSAYSVFLYKPGSLRHPALLMCENACGGRSFLEITPGQFSATIQPTSIPTTDTFSSLAQKLVRSRSNASSPQVEIETPCQLVLNVQVKHDEKGQHRLYYVWTASAEGVFVQKTMLESSPTTTDQGIYYRNVFRTVDEERNCVKLLTSSDPCSGCREVRPTSTYGDEDTFLNSAAFYARSNSEVKLAFKGLFSVTRPRQFYFEWDLPLLELMDFQLPSVLYVGHEFVANCSVSTIYFAYGTLIYHQTDFTNRLSNHTETETWTPNGHRVVSRRVTFFEGNETHTLTCSAPLWNWSQRVEKSVHVFVEYPAVPRVEGDAGEELVSVQNGQENVTLACSAVGKPRPSLEWGLPSRQNISSLLEIITSEDDEDETRVTSTISMPRITTVLLGTYRCNVDNVFGNSSKAYNLQIPIEGLSVATKAGLSSGLGAVVVIGIVTALLIYRKILLQRKEYRTKTAEAIREFKEGVKHAQKEKEAAFSTTFKSGRKGSGGGGGGTNIFKKLGLGKEKIKSECHIYDSKEHTHHASILELPYDDSFEVDVAKWKIEDTLLGQGAFGVVRKGSVETEGHARQVVAVKVLKSSVEIDDFKSFLTELKIMAFIGKHPNIVNLVAACTHNIEQRDVMIGVEFCANGSLQDYFKEKRNVFQTLDGSLEAESSRRTYANLNNSVALTELDLYTWSYQIANGMEFLAGKKVLHGDLATRNVLLALDKTAKISDFGLSRLLLDSKNYTKKSRVPLPWKWMSIEALKALSFSSASDVWAFGVTLFEIFTLGEVPYAGLSFGPEFIAQLESGFRLSKPPLATEYVYNIMKHCWNADAEARVTFVQLKTAFSELLDVFTNPSGAPVPVTRERLNTPTSREFQRSPVPHPRTRGRGQQLQQNWYSNRPIQIPNLYLNV